VKKYGQFTAVNHMNLEVKEGSIYGFLGPNGAGKSTTLSIIATLLRMNEGHVTIDGLDLEKQKSKIRQLIGWVPQEIVLYPRMSIRENIRFYGSLYGLHGAKLEQACEEALKVVSLDQDTGRKVMGLSGGMQRRLNIACGIAHKPKLIFFDEPTVAVDPQSRNRILEGIKRLKEEGATIVYTSHYMEEVEQICDRIVIMDKGKSVAVGTKDELKKMIKNTETIKVEVFGLTGEQMSELRSQPHVYENEYNGSMLTLRYSGGRHNLVRLMEFFKEHDISFGRVVTELPTLNDVFLEITGKELRD